MESMHYYHDYLEQCYNTIEKLSTDLHNIYVRRNNLANICYANLNLLESNGITKEIIDDLILCNRMAFHCYDRHVRSHAVYPYRLYQHKKHPQKHGLGYYPVPCLLFRSC